MDLNGVKLLLCIAAYAGFGQATCTGPYLFTCSDNTCISKARTCDGKRDCANGKDESYLKAGCGNSYCKLRNMAIVTANGYFCKRSCSPNAQNPCVKLKKCVCDDECGYSCVNPVSPCPASIPDVEYAIGHEIIRFVGGMRRVLPAPESYEFGDMIKYHCKPGMTLVGPLPRCTGARRWSRQLPQCIGNHCSSNPCMNGGTCVNQADRYVCFCAEEYEGSDCDRRRYDQCQSQPCRNGGTCYNAGEYEPRCSCSSGYSGIFCEEEMRCSSPVMPERGYVEEEKKNWMPGDTATSRCLDGFELFGNNIQTCMANGEWSGEMAECIRNICTLDYFLLDVDIYVHGFEYEQLYTRKFSVEETVVLGCKDGFIPFRQNSSLIPPMIQCEYGGRWFPDSSDIYCDRPATTICTDPELPDFLVIDEFREPPQFVTGTLLRMHCIADLVLNGPNTIVCLSDGTWSEIPTCAIPETGCATNPELLAEGVTTSVTNGRQMKELFSTGEQLNVLCERQNSQILSETDGLTNSTTCSENGEWNPALQGFKCVQVCRWPSNAGDGLPVVNVQNDVFFPNQKLYPECPPLFRHKGSNVIKCLENGTWSSMSACEPIGCWVDLDHLDESVSISGHSNETLSGVEFSVGQQLELVCAKQGRRVQGNLPGIITCMGKNKWTSDYKLYRCRSGTCAFRCLARDGPCACDFGCEARGDCCDDFAEICEK